MKDWKELKWYMFLACILVLTGVVGLTRWFSTIDLIAKIEI